MTDPDFMTNQESLGLAAAISPAALQLERIIELVQRGKDYYDRLPVDFKERVTLKTPGVENFDLPEAIAGMAPDVREAWLSDLHENLRLLRAVLDKASAEIGLTGDDAKTFEGILTVIHGMGAKSKRELQRFVETALARDGGYAVAVALPPEKGRPQRVEIRFVHDLSDSARADLKLPALPG